MRPRISGAANQLSRLVFVENDVSHKRAHHIEKVLDLESKLGVNLAAAKPELLLPQNVLAEDYRDRRLHADGCWGVRPVGKEERKKSECAAVLRSSRKEGGK